jgi:hypothetical protein
MKKILLIVFLFTFIYGSSIAGIKPFLPTDDIDEQFQAGKGHTSDGSEANFVLEDKIEKDTGIGAGELQLKEKKALRTEDSALYNIGVLIALIVLFFISLVTNYTLLRWRSRYKDQLISFPESLQDQFENLRENLKKQINLNQEVAKSVTKKYDEIFESFSALQTSLNQKDKEIERLKKGYDLQILKKYVIKLMRVADTCNAIIQDPKVSNETKNETTFILESLHDLLEDLGIEKYTIKAGVSTTSEEFGLPPANEWVKVNTDKKAQVFKVKKTITEGYFINAETKEVLKYPKIEVYVKGENNE